MLWHGKGKGKGCGRCAFSRLRQREGERERDILLLHNSIPRPNSVDQVGGNGGNDGGMVGTVVGTGGRIILVTVPVFSVHRTALRAVRGARGAQEGLERGLKGLTTAAACRCDRISGRREGVGKSLFSLGSLTGQLLLTLPSTGCNYNNNTLPINRPRCSSFLCIDSCPLFLTAKKCWQWYRSPGTLTLFLLMIDYCTGGFRSAIETMNPSLHHHPIIRILHSLSAE